MYYLIYVRNILINHRGIILNCEKKVMTIIIVWFLSDFIININLLKTNLKMPKTYNQKS